MSKRTSIYIGSELTRLLNGRSDANSGLRSTSGVLNAVADRYLEIVRRSLPTLTEGEWCLIWDSLNGVWAQDNAGLYVPGIIMGVSDSISLDALDQKWSVDGKALLSKLHEMSFCNLVAIVDSAELFWADNAAEDENISDVVRRIVGEQHVQEE